MAAGGEEKVDTGGPAVDMSTHRDWTPRTIYTLGFLSLIYSFNFFDRNLIGLVLPLMQKDFALSDTALALISGLAFILFYSLAGVPIARIADLKSRRNIVAITFAFWSLMTALMAAAVNVWQLVLLRFLQGAGEAGGLPASQSMVSDIFSRHRRPLALAILSAGSIIAGLLWTPAAGWLADNFGWEAAFIAAGAPGVVLAVIFLLTVREPQRGATEPRGAILDKASFKEAVGFLTGQRSYLMVLAGGSFIGIVTAINFTWAVTFIVRVHGMSLTEIGLTVGPIRGIIGAGSGILGAVVAQRLARRDERWNIWIPAFGSLLAAPAEILFLLAPSPSLSLVGLSLQSLFGGLCMPALYALCIGLARIRMRTLASAIFLLFVNMVGQTLGPLLIGLGTDALTPDFGNEAIRYSMLAVMPACSAAAGLCFLVGARFLARDMVRAVHDRDAAEQFKV